MRKKEWESIVEIPSPGFNSSPTPSVAELEAEKERQLQELLDLNKLPHTFSDGVNHGY